MTRWSDRAFQLLLSAYPRGFRDEYGREMALLFADRYRSAASIGERAMLWLESLAGLAVEVPKEHGRVLAEDLRQAVRALRHHPLFAATIVITLALGIGANTAIFSLLNAVSLRTLPLADPGELSVVRIDAPVPIPQRFAWPMYTRLRDSAPAGSIAAMSRVARTHAQWGGGELEQTYTQLVSGEYFQVLRVPMALGRALGPEDNRAPGSHPVAVISHGYWQRRFGGSADVLGRKLTLNGSPFTIVGVTAGSFAGVWLESPVDFWVPIAMQHDIHYSQNFSAGDDANHREPWMTQQRVLWLDIIARAPRANHAAITGPLNQTLPRLLPPGASRARLALAPFGTGFSRLRERFLNPLYLLMAMAGLVLLIACANAANLLLARAQARQREIAVRMSLGAGRLRLVQQLLTESLLLVTLAGVIALLVSHWVSSVLVRMAVAEADSPVPFEAAIDLRVLAFAMAVAVLTTLLFGLAPALRSTKLDLTGALKTGSRGAGARTSYGRLLVALQVALSLVLVSATGLLIHSFHNLVTLDLGFDQEHILTANLATSLMPRKTPEQLPEFHRRLLERVSAVPGVRSASLAMCGALQGCRSLNDGYTVEGYHASSPQEQIGFLLNIVGPQYFETMGMRLTEGRTFDVRDNPSTTRVVVVNETLARKYFAGRRATGQRIGMGGKLDTEIVGVVRDARMLNVREQPMPSAFYPLAQMRELAHVLEVRTHGEPGLAVAALRRAIGEAAPEIPFSRITVMSELVNRNLSQDRLILSLASYFGALALGLAGFGLFSILSFAVARRTSEFGIRIALGAPVRRVVWTVCREALLIVLAGVLVGLPVVLAGARAMRFLLFGVGPQDGSALAGAATVLLVVGAAAGVVPAWRASRVDPVTALRVE